MLQQDREESHIVARYRRMWPAFDPAIYDYKTAKGARLAAIIDETGGVPRLALELGVGPGGVAAQVSRSGARVIGIDLSPDALVLAREHCKGMDVHLMRASGFALPFRSGSLDVVYASQVLHLFDHAGRLALMKEAHRALKPGGRFLFDMKNVASHLTRYLTNSPRRRQRNFPPKAELIALLHEAGFGSIDRRPGLLPGLRSARVPNLAIFRALAHTTFYVAARP